MSTTGFNFKKDGKSDDGREMARFLSANHTIAELPAGTYALATTIVGPGQLGVLQPNHSYFFDPNTGALLLKVS